jgi:hypothetical protein
MWLKGNQRCRWTTRVESQFLREHLSYTKLNQESADFPENLIVKAKTLAMIPINTDQKA